MTAERKGGPAGPSAPTPDRCVDQWHGNGTPAAYVDELNARAAAEHQETCEHCGGDHRPVDPLCLPAAFRALVSEEARRISSHGARVREGMRLARERRAAEEEQP